METRLQRRRRRSSGGESRFDRVPEEVKLAIFARLDAKALVSASIVCKNWNAYLRNSAIRALALNPSVSGASSCFLLKICYKDGTTDLDLRHAYVRVDHSGGCSAVEVLNNIVDDFRGWDISCNGALVSFPKWITYSDAITPRIVVCHPSLRWIKTVCLTRTSSIPMDYHCNGFRGVSFDSSTSHFTLLFGFRRKGFIDDSYEIRIYSSQSCKWKYIVPEMDVNLGVQSLDGNAIFSQGCFFWLHKNHSERWYEGLLIFDLKNKQLGNLPFPACPAHPNVGIQCYGWELRGCDGAVVLVHYKSPPFPNEVVVAWRLDQSGNTWASWKWDPVLHRPQLIQCPYKPWFDMDKNGCWLWSEKADWKNREIPQDLIMLGDNGEDQQSIPMSLVASCLGLPPDSYPHVDGLWVLQTITLWETLATL